MSTVTPDDIPVSVTRLIYTDPAGCVLSQNQAAVMFTHYWPAIEQHIREQIAQEIDAAADRVFSEYTEDAMKARGLGLRAAARIARATTEEGPVSTVTSEDFTPDEQDDPHAGCYEPHLNAAGEYVDCNGNPY
jgi:hypothetical protein